ncbi:MAG: type II toxin-antitoxin system VapC family toxin [Thermomicrobiales bacterium]|nr:type II toxin-antitoxin system VapC family toxin [Thermomicrobiales bacterium]
MIVLDTTIVIDHLRGHPAAQQAVSNASARDVRLACSVVTKVEILSGMRAYEEPQIRGLFAGIEWVDVSDEIAELAGLTANQFMRSYPGIDTADYIIAATAARLTAVLWTTNLKHFPMFENLTRPY